MITILMEALVLVIGVGLHGVGLVLHTASPTARTTVAVAVTVARQNIITGPDTIIPATDIVVHRQRNHPNPLASPGGMITVSHRTMIISTRTETANIHPRVIAMSMKASTTVRNHPASAEVCLIRLAHHADRIRNHLSIGTIRRKCAGHDTVNAASQGIAIVDK